MGHGARVGRVRLLAVAGRVEVAEWLRLWGVAWGKASVGEIVGQRRVEHEGRDGLGLGGLEGRSLVEEEVSMWSTASG